MGDGYYLDILLFALVAAFLIFRLRSVLGRRDGFQGKRESPLPSPPAPRDDASPRLPEERTGETAGPPPIPGSLEAGIASIRAADPTFSAPTFADGASKAFEWILNAFAAGELDTLRPLLSPDVFANFASSIEERAAAGERLESKLIDLKSVDLVEAYMAGRTAHVTARFVSQQIVVVRNEAGEVVEGDPEEVTEVTDHWTFARDTRSPDPNWSLVATGAPD